MTSRGKIHLIIGPVFSGKTTELILRKNRLLFSLRESILIKPILNIYDPLDECSPIEGYTNTHDGYGTSCYHCQRENLLDLMPIINQDDEITDVLIDDGHLFTDVPEFCQIMTTLGYNIHISSLNSDYSMQEVYCVTKLTPIADEILILTSYCFKCKNYNGCFSRNDFGVVQPYCKECFFPKRKLCDDNFNQ